MASPDLEALVSPKIRTAIQAAVEKIGNKEFLEITGIDQEQLDSIHAGREIYVNVGVVTLACQINKSHGDVDPSHSSVTECLKGTTIRIPKTAVEQKSFDPGKSRRIRPFPPRSSTRPNPFYERRSFRLLGFSANTLTFLLLGYLLGGIALSPLAGQPSCTGVTISPPGLSPCIGSIIGIVAGAIGGLGYTYYYFVKKM